MNGIKTAQNKTFLREIVAGFALPALHHTSPLSPRGFAVTTLTSLDSH
jgi:hypothetical protein